MRILKLYLLMLYWFLIALLFFPYMLPRMIRRLYTSIADAWYDHLISVYDNCKEQLSALKRSGGRK